MQRLEVSGAVRLIYKSLGVKGLITCLSRIWISPLNVSCGHRWQEDLRLYAKTMWMPEGV